MNKNIVAKVLAAAIVLACTASPTWSADTITLRVGDSFPGGHYIVPLLKKWMDEATRRSDGRIKFEYFGSEQLGKAKDLLSLTLSGVSDIS
jgi:TRAP-type C4-dicarboxylate transport system substrate-binding protein